MIIEEQLEIAKAFQDFFLDLFSTSSPFRADLERSSHAIQLVVTDTMNSHLLWRYTKEEVFKSLKQMGPLKSLGGEEGFSGNF